MSDRFQRPERERSGALLLAPITRGVVGPEAEVVGVVALLQFCVGIC